MDGMLIVAKSICEVNKLKTLLSRELDIKDLMLEKTKRGLSLEKRCWLNSNQNTIWLLDHN
jgi:hypothetical protein